MPCHPGQPGCSSAAVLASAAAMCTRSLLPLTCTWTWTWTWTRSWTCPCVHTLARPAAHMHMDTLMDMSLCTHARSCHTRSQERTEGCACQAVTTHYVSHACDCVVPSPVRNPTPPRARVHLRVPLTTRSEAGCRLAERHRRFCRRQSPRTTRQQPARSPREPLGRSADIRRSRLSIHQRGDGAAAHARADVLDLLCACTGTCTRAVPSTHFCTPARPLPSHTAAGTGSAHDARPSARDAHAVCARARMYVCTFCGPCAPSGLIVRAQRDVPACCARHRASHMCCTRAPSLAHSSRTGTTCAHVHVGSSNG